MLAESKLDILQLQCPLCHFFYDANTEEKPGILTAHCLRCGVEIVWGHEQDIEEGTYKGTAVSVFDE